ncbi:hypothetical protein BsWGS_13284 [Bradybaena similaris]
MHEKEILQNLAKSGQLASQTHTRALTHLLLNKALRCSLIQDINVSSNSDSQPPADKSTTRFDRFRQQSPFCSNCGSQDGVLEFQNSDEYRAIKKDLHEKLHHYCPNCQHTIDLPDGSKNTWQGRKQVSQQQSVRDNLCHRCMGANADEHLKTNTDVEDVSEDERQHYVKRSTSLPCEKTPGTHFSRRMSECQCDGPNGSSLCRMHKGQQPVLSDVFQSIRETNIVKIDVSREDRPCSPGEEGVVSLREKVNNEWYKRGAERQADQSCSHCQLCVKCRQPLKQNGQDLILQEGQSQEHQGSCQQFIIGKDGELQQSSYNLETDGSTELWSKATSDHGYMRSSESQCNRTDESQLCKKSYEEQQYRRCEAQQYKKSGDQLYNRSNVDQEYKKSENPQFKKSQDPQYKRAGDVKQQRAEDQEYRKPEAQRYKRSHEDQQFKRSEDQQFKQSEDRQYKRSEKPFYKQSEDQQYKRPEDTKFKRSEDQQYKRSEEPLYKRPEDRMHKRSEDQMYMISEVSEDQKYMKPGADLQYRKQKVQQFTGTKDDQHQQSKNGLLDNKSDEQQHSGAEDESDKTNIEDQVSRKQNNDLRNEKINEGFQYIKLNNQQYTDANNESHPQSASSYSYGKAADVMPKDEQIVEKSFDYQNRSSSGHKDTGTTQEFGGNTFKKQDEKTSYDLQNERTNKNVRTNGNSQPERTTHDLVSKRTSDNPQTVKVSRDVLNKGTSDDIFVRSSGNKQSEQVRRDVMKKATSNNIFMRTRGDPRSGNISRDLLSKGSTDNPQSLKVSHDMLNKGTNDNIFVKTTGNPQSEIVGHGQQYTRTSAKQQSERVSHDLHSKETNNIFVRTSSNPQSERVIHDQRSTRTSDNVRLRTGGDQQYKRTGDYISTINNQQFARTTDNLYIRSSDNQDTRTSNNQQHPRTSETQQYMRTCGNQKLMTARDAEQCENNTAFQLPESGEEYKRCSDSPQQSRTGSDHQQHTSSSRKQEYISDRGNKVSCFTCRCQQKLDCQKFQRQMSSILNDRCAECSNMDEAEGQEKYNFDAAMKLLSGYMNNISLVCECYYESCSKDSLSLLERRHLRMFHKGVLPVKQLPQKTPDTSSHEDTTGRPHRCSCFSSVSRPPRVGRSLSEDRSQSQAPGTDRSQSHAPGTDRSQSQAPGTDRSQNFVRFSDAGPCQDPDLEDDSQLGDMFHRENKPHSSGRSQATGKPQFCVRFSDTGAEIRQANRNSHYTEMSETCSSSLTSECQLKDLYSSSSSHEDRKPVLSSESATDTTLNSQSFEAVLAKCTPSFDSSRADSKPGSSSLKNLACAQKSGHRVAGRTRNRFLVRQRQNTVSGTHLPQGVFIEGVSAFPTKASKTLSKSSKSKVRSGRNNTEQGIFIRTKPGSYIVKKPKEDSSIHLLQVNPGNYVKLNM